MNENKLKINLLSNELKVVFVINIKKIRFHFFSLRRPQMKDVFNNFLHKEEERKRTKINKTIIYGK